MDVIDYDQVRVAESKGCLTYAGLWLRGLNVALQHAFYPDFSFLQLRRRVTPDTPAATFNGWPKDPKARGRSLDRLVTRLVYLVRHEGLTLAQVLQEDTSVSSRRARMIASFRRRCPPAFYQHYVPWLRDQGWVPLHSQYPVVWPEARVGTCIDLICEDADGRWVVVENKVGYWAFWSQYLSRHCAAPFAFLTDAPRWQHQLYLTLALSMLKRRHPAQPVNYVASTVVRLSDQGVRSDPLRPWGKRMAVLRSAWAVLYAKSATSRAQARKECREARKRKRGRGSKNNNGKKRQKTRMKSS